ncbi:MAG: right-handed parallel beta-helix repeat-containing protein, partial [Actinomycetota bacterium]
MTTRRATTMRVLAAATVLSGSTLILPGAASALQITVDDVSDVIDPADGVTTLPEAVATANGTPGADEIVFDPAVFDPAGGPYTITLGATLQIADDLTITGPGVDVLDVAATADPNGTFVIDLVDATLTVTDLSITGSAGPGIAVYGSNSPVTIERVRITGGAADGLLTVGDVRPGDSDPTPVGDVRVLDSDLDLNAESGLDADLIGALDIDGSSFGQNGDEGIYAAGAGVVTIDETDLTGNDLEGAYLVVTSTIDIADVTASANGSDNLFVAEAGAITISDSTFLGAVADDADGIEI